MQLLQVVNLAQSQLARYQYNTYILFRNSEMESFYV